MGKAIKIPSTTIGQLFGRWKVDGDPLFVGHGRGWKIPCACSCQKQIRRSVNWGSLRQGQSVSCGCYNREVAAARMRVAARTHGMWQSSECRILSGMRTRCYNAKSKDYRRYGGRGISICDRWMGNGGFEHFLADMGTKPGDGYSIDRINNNGPYSPENCRWATFKDQGRNKKANRILTHNGQSKCLAAWAEENGLSTRILWQRLKSGWSMELALKIPVSTENSANRTRDAKGNFSGGVFATAKA